MISDLDSRQRQHRAPSPSECHRSETSCRGRDRQPGSYGSRHHRRPTQGRTKDALGDQPSGPSFAKERDDIHSLEVMQHFEAASTQLERWYERKVDEARSDAFQRTQAERSALVERISHLEEKLHMLRMSKKGQS